MYRVIHDTKNSEDVLNLAQGKGFLQGVFIKFGITESDNASGIRNGGFGSTN